LKTNNRFGFPHMEKTYLLSGFSIPVFPDERYGFSIISIFSMVIPVGFVEIKTKSVLKVC